VRGVNRLSGKPMKACMKPASQAETLRLVVDAAAEMEA